VVVVLGRGGWLCRFDGLVGRGEGRRVLSIEVLGDGLRWLEKIIFRGLV
jgi:hypothetical protein